MRMPCEWYNFTLGPELLKCTVSKLNEPRDFKKRLVAIGL